MWKIKRFKDFVAQSEWVRANRDRYQIVELFVENGYAVEYKRLIVIG